MNHEKLLTPQEVATYLRVSGMTVYRQIKGGHLRSVRVGRQYRIPESAVTEWLEKGRASA